MRKKNFLNLREAIIASWDASTAYHVDEFDPNKPSRGQCLVSSLVLQEYLGGELISAIVTQDGFTSENHYWLRLNGVDVDITWDQFAIGTYIESKRVISTNSVLKNTSVIERYDTLINRVDKYLKS